MGNYVEELSRTQKMLGLGLHFCDDDFSYD
jgi:hypothetical protein